MKRLNIEGNDFQELIENEGEDSFLDSKEFFPYKTPPDLGLAKIHGLARRVCKPIKHELYHGSTCHCCGLPVDNEQYEICCDPTAF